MTFRPERYPADWLAIRAGILARAGNRCERCRAPNGVTIARGEPDTRDEGTYMLERGEVFDAETGEPRGIARGSEYEAARFVRVILTVAHLDHDEGNNDPSNLSAFCQRCHLNHDRADNRRRRAENAHAVRAVARLPGVK